MTITEKKNFQKHNHKCRLCLALSLMLVIGLSITKIIFVNRSATWGRNLEAIKKEAQIIRQENQIIKSEIAQKNGGLTQLSQTAITQGFTDKPQVKFINNEWELAFKSN